jgi:hypothetical protein
MSLDKVTGMKAVSTNYCVDEMSVGQMFFGEKTRCRNLTPAVHLFKFVITDYKLIPIP